MQFPIRLLLTLTTLVGILIYCVTNPSQSTFLISCVPIPLALALTCRYVLLCSHKGSLLGAFVTAVLIGGTWLAWASYDQTFNKGNVGYLIGGGWSSVAASAVFGVIAGAFCGGISMSLYLIIAGGIDKVLVS